MNSLTPFPSVENIYIHYRVVQFLRSQHLHRYNLFSNLNNSGLDCYVGLSYASAFDYVDDMTQVSSYMNIYL